MIEAIGMFAREARGKDARGKERSRGRVNITLESRVYIMIHDVYMYVQLYILKFYIY